MNDAQRFIDALVASHEHLSEVVGALSPSAVTSPSYCSEWSVADVLSHLGSGAEIFSLLLDAAVKGEAPPDRERYSAIWDAWNAKAPADQAADSLSSNGRLVAEFSSYDEAERAGMRLPFFGRELDAAGLGRMRLSEHALHTFDVEVALDDQARVQPAAVELLIDTLVDSAPHLGKASQQQIRRAVVTTAPARGFVVESDDAVRLVSLEGDERADAIELPSEAFLRLVYGRLDDADAPTIAPVDRPALEELRSLFPGF